jgi:hypothetical protein
MRGLFRTLEASSRPVKETRITEVTQVTQVTKVTQAGAF